MVSTLCVSCYLAKTHKDRRPVTIQLRGEVRLEVGGARMEGRLPGRLGRALLAFLVLNRHRAVTRDELVGALWPAAVPRDPAATLSTLLSGIRRASASACAATSTSTIASAGSSSRSSERP